MVLDAPRVISAQFLSQLSINSLVDPTWPGLEINNTRDASASRFPAVNVETRRVLTKEGILARVKGGLFSVALCEACLILSSGTGSFHSPGCFVSLGGLIVPHLVYLGSDLLTQRGVKCIKKETASRPRRSWRYWLRSEGSMDSLQTPICGPWELTKGLSMWGGRVAFMSITRVARRSTGSMIAKISSR